MIDEIVLQHQKSWHQIDQFSPGLGQKLKSYLDFFPAEANEAIFSMVPRASSELQKDDQHFLIAFLLFRYRLV